jgi:UDP:flavonoid glycosyltransferase YjiC (YdhE family)
MPMAHDQPDNAARLHRLNAGTSLTPSQFTPDRLANALSKLLHDPSIIASARQLASQVSASHASASLPTIIDWLQTRAVTRF